VSTSSSRKRTEKSGLDCQNKFPEESTAIQNFTTAIQNFTEMEKERLHSFLGNFKLPRLPQLLKEKTGLPVK
jgi:hypothetical protein